MEKSIIIDCEIPITVKGDHMEMIETIVKLSNITMERAKEIGTVTREFQKEIEKVICVQ